MTHHYKFENLPQYFINYSEFAKQNPGSQATTPPNLGLIDQEYSKSDNQELDKTSKRPWERFANHINQLNIQSPENVSYKVLYLTRHGFGVHNHYHKTVGSDAWNNYWSHLDGNGTVSWVDAKLAETGIQQARELSDFWGNAVNTDKVPLPDTFYTSPLARCLETSKLVFTRLAEDAGKQFRPVVKELLRERLADHTCDKRSTRTWITDHYPLYIIEPGFSEDDVLWKPDRYESIEEHVARKQRVLEDIFSTDPGHFISLTVHSYAISAILRTCGAEEFRVREGSTIALLVRGERLDTR
ncbi:histidine phosphatase superfamily [Aspergillus avenaceus]|uniref:Histidine phosphatase superfamily n=1 Tax=Aspergillus avenaceus TaxID=36643 RepID=A0A5N6TX96_ASPAV|nr:histidine phosphatase superfamily [Aspergillus avenaceus]